MFEDFVDVMPLRRAWREILRYLGILLLGMTVCRCISVNYTEIVLVDALCPIQLWSARCVK